MSKPEHPPTSRRIIVVTGLPRSGTSMMMQMLHAGGVPVLADQDGRADVDNPRGYFEFRPATALASDSAWMPRALGKAFKLVPMLLRHLPSEYCYDVIFIQRDLHEVIASQTLMKAHRHEEGAVIDVDQLVGVYERHLQRTVAWLDEQNHMRVLNLIYNQVLHHPLDAAERIAGFLYGGRVLDTQAMAAIVDSTLYRQRRVGSDVLSRPGSGGDVLV